MGYGLGDCDVIQVVDEFRAKIPNRRHERGLDTANSSTASLVAH